MPILEYTSFYLVGIKGVAMTALAQCLLDAGKTVRGSDVAEAFVTQPILDHRQVEVDLGFDRPLPDETECVIYTAAHQSQHNPQVQTAIAQGIPTYTHAQALAELFNRKKGIAVCGVGGKSTTSAMVAFILQQAGLQPAFAVGVGDIIGLGKTGQWRQAAEWFVAEADEYVTDPAAAQQGQEITPRFHFMEPYITICTNLQFDHPDVYRDFAHTKAVFAQFFGQLKPGGALIVNADDAELLKLAQQVTDEHQGQLYSFGENPEATAQLQNYSSETGSTRIEFLWQGQPYQITLKIPGKYNAANALAAWVAAVVAGISPEQASAALAEFRSTQRRAQFIGVKNGVTFYDDYAHHPNEVSQLIQAFKEWYPDKKLVIAFQSHTFSRTKSLFSDFVTAFADADEVVMIDIFPSAREKADESISSTLLCEAISTRYPDLPAHNFGTLEKLAAYLAQTLKAGDVCVTVGAGDIYHLHELLA